MGTLRRLGSLETHGAPVLSVYLGLEPAAVLACEAELDALQASSPSEPTRAAIGRALSMLRAMPAFTHGTRGLAAFSCAWGGELVTVPLPCSVASMAVLDALPWLEPLAGIFTAGDWGIVAVGPRTARLFRGGESGLVEFAHLRFTDSRAPARLSRPDPTGPAAARPSRRAKRIAELLERAHQRKAFDRVAVAAPRKLWPAIEGALQNDLRARLAGFTALKLHRASAQEIGHVLAPMLQSPHSALRLWRTTTSDSGHRTATLQSQSARFASSPPARRRVRGAELEPALRAGSQDARSKEAACH